MTTEARRTVTVEMMDEMYDTYLERVDGPDGKRFHRAVGDRQEALMRQGYDLDEALALATIDEIAAAA